MNLRIDHLGLPHGLTHPYTVLETAHHAVAVLAQTEDQKFLLIKEYRHPTKRWVLSCPGGRIDSGESPIEAAQRELLEETGYSAKEFFHLGSAHPFASVCDQMIHYVYAKEAHLLQSPQLEPFELIETTLVTSVEIKHLIASYEPIDGVLCTALFFKSLQTA